MYVGDHMILYYIRIYYTAIEPRGKLRLGRLGYENGITII